MESHRGRSKRITDAKKGIESEADQASTYIDVVRIEVVRDITVLAGPGLEGLELALRLAHIGVEVVEIAELLSPESSIGVGRVVALVVLNVDEDVVLLSLREELLVVLKQLHCWLCDEDVDAALDGVQGNRVVSCVGREDCNFD